MVNINPATNNTMDKPNCHQGTVLGTPKGIRAIITIGELKGMILAHTATELLGLDIAGVINAIEKIMSIVIGKLNDWASLISSLIALYIAADAMAWGEPVLESAITLVHDGHLYYRGRNAVDLAQTETLEAVARLLRGGDGYASLSLNRPLPPTDGTMRARIFAALAQRCAVGEPQDAPGEAATLLDILTDAVTADRHGGVIHERLGWAWKCGPRGSDLIRRTLVLMADHELNASTFAARVAASTGASLAACALAGLTTLSGPLHGGAPAQVLWLAAHAQQLGDSEAMSARLIHWPGGPGFGHPLYPRGDPRARALLQQFTASAPMESLEAARHAATGEPANVDFALAALSEALDLPDDAPFAMFAIARCAGWMAHALEQRQTGALIRPRARYTGVVPKI